MLYSFASASVFILVFNLFPALPGTPSSYKELLPDLPVTGWIVLIILSFIPTLLGFGLYNMSTKYTKTNTIFS